MLDIQVNNSGETVKSSACPAKQHTQQTLKIENES
jgi:hypothetical protein